MDHEKLHAKADRLLTKVIKQCFIENDETRTRFEARKLIREFCEEIDDFSLRVETYKILNAEKFQDLKDRYNKEEPEVIKMEKSKENKLFNNVIKSGDGETVTVYLNGDEDEAVSFKKIKSFRFEDSYYVLLQNTFDNKTNYFRYYSEKGEDGEVIEKLLRVNDEQQESLFKFLGY